MVESTNGLLYGCSEGGGTSSLGTLFSYDISTNTVTKKVDFDGTNGKYPSGSLLQSSNGKFYGMCRKGGANNKGNIFEFDPSNDVFTTKLDFDVANGSIGDAGNLIEVTYIISSILDDNQKHSLTIYPNPSNSLVSFSSKDAIELIEIYTIAGQKVGQYNNTNTIDISNLTNGVYFAKIITATNNSVMQKIIKE
ncbi:MAG: T9SS type A sorting domain-containing protein [Flavobacteriales bacterium]|nr:T9SS type A sorting domain-containing protein [Flavobacteriales bacterium]